MKNWSILPHRWRARQELAQHAAAIADILETPPIAPRLDGVVLFSMIGSLDVLPYLVAVKSLWQHLGRGRVALLDDGTLTGTDKALLAHHCGDPEILALARVDTSGFPDGGNWPRLLSVLDRRSSEFWIVLDSYTVTLGETPDISEALALNRSFASPRTISGTRKVQIQPMADFSSALLARNDAKPSVAALIESRLPEIARPDWRYLAGSGGLTGFAAGGPGRSLAAAFLAKVEELAGAEALGARGLAQIASNFHIANERRAAVLPGERYVNCTMQGFADDASFVRFDEGHRSINGYFTSASRRAIDRLKG